jgi:LysR family hydrogen peroxide-inducible transcriptional activator
MNAIHRRWYRGAVSRWSPHPVSLRQLQYVVAVAEHKSFRRAAEACAVAQPSLSAQVAQLESVIGVQVFERLPRSVVVTAAGAAVLERAQRVLREADDLMAEVARAHDPFAGTLPIGVIPTVAPYLLPVVAPALRAKYPRLQILWTEEKTPRLVERIRSGDLEAGIVAVESDLGDLHTEALGRDPFVLAVPKGHRLASAAPAKVDELAEEKVLVLDDGHCFRDQALDVCHRGGADEASLRSTSLSTLAQLVAGGAGITLLPSIAVRTENRARGLVVRPFGARGPHRTLALAWRKRAPVEGTLRALVPLLASAVAKVAETYR